MAELSKGKKIIIGLLVVATLVGATVGAFVAVKAIQNNHFTNSGTSGSIKPNPTPNPIPGGSIEKPSGKQDVDKPSGSISAGDKGDEKLDKPSGSEQGGEEILPGGESGGSEIVVPPTLTEAQYKSQFEASLPSVVQGYFNEHIESLSFFKVSDLKIQLINYETGKIYFKGVQQNKEKFFELECEEIKNATNYEELSKNLSGLDFTTENSRGVTIQEQGLANEIAEYALQQESVLNYINKNGIDISNYSVLNATEFYSKDGYRTSNITILGEDKMLTISLAGRTGYCSTQEEYLNKLKEGFFDFAEVTSCEDYSEIDYIEALMQRLPENVKNTVGFDGVEL